MARKSRKPGKPVGEWVGGILEAPSEADPHSPPPYAGVWIEVPAGTVVGVLLDEHPTPQLLAETLREAMAHPRQGRPRTPARLRVADPRLARALRPFARAGTEVVLGPTPELEPFARTLRQSAAEAQEPSYFEDGTVTEPAIRRLFEAAQALSESEAWDRLGESWVDVDVPEAGLEGGRATLVSPEGMPRALVLFTSEEAIEAFVRRGKRALRAGRQHFDAEFLTLAFVPARDLPARMRREAMEHHWPVAGVDAFPVFERRAADGTSPIASDNDVRALHAAARQILAFLNGPARASRKRPKARSKPSVASKRILQLRIALTEVEPKVWRRVRVPAEMSLHDLSFVLNTAMGWQSYHLYEFQGLSRGDERTYGIPSDDGYGQPDIDSSKVPAGELFVRKRQKVRYHYDFGDAWIHDVVLEDVLQAEPEVDYPVCVAGERACPPEDCGGPYGFAQLLRAVRGPVNARQEELLEWIGGSFDADRFVLAEANERLRKLPELLEAAEREE